MLLLGLTGSIGMGKSTTAKLFAEAGVPVYDADATVHMLYEGEAVPAIEAAFPGTTADGKVDRNKLSARVVHDPAARQLPDAEKRRRADFVVDTSDGLDPVRARIRDILTEAVKMPRRRS